MILEELSAVVLAAGRSRRMGRPKALLPVDGEPLLAHTLRTLRAYGIPRAIVVLGENADAVRARVPLAMRDVVINPDVDRGPFSSLELAMQRLVDENGHTPAVLVQPVDVPAPSRDVCEVLAAWAEVPGTLAAVPVWRGRGGHPVCLTAAGTNALRSAALEVRRLDLLLRTWEERVQRVPVDDPRVCMNWNTPKDVRGQRPGASAADSRN